MGPSENRQVVFGHVGVRSYRSFRARAAVPEGFSVRFASEWKRRRSSCRSPACRCRGHTGHFGREQLFRSADCALCVGIRHKPHSQGARARTVVTNGAGVTEVSTRSRRRRTPRTVRRRTPPPPLPTTPLCTIPAAPQKKAFPVGRSLPRRLCDALLGHAHGLGDLGLRQAGSLSYLGQVLGADRQDPLLVRILQGGAVIGVDELVQELRTGAGEELRVPKTPTRAPGSPRCLSFRTPMDGHGHRCAGTRRHFGASASTDHAKTNIPVSRGMQADSCSEYVGWGRLPQLLDAQKGEALELIPYPRAGRASGDARRFPAARRGWGGRRRDHRG